MYEQKKDWEISFLSCFSLALVERNCIHSSMCVCVCVCALLGLWSLCFDTVKLTAAASNILVRLLKTRLAAGSKVLALL